MRVDVECPAEAADDPDEDEHVDLEDVEGEGDAEANCIKIGLPGKSILRVRHYRVSHPIIHRGFSDKF